MDIETKIISYFEGELSPQECLELEKLSKEDTCVKETLEHYRLIYESFDQAKTFAPSENLQNRFDTFLENQLKDQNINSDSKLKTAKIIRFYPALKMVAAVGLLLIGIFVGTEYSKNNAMSDMTNEMANMRHQINQLMNEESSMARIQAVNMTSEVELQKNENDISSLLISTLQNDKSSNVRLAAVQSLENFISDEQVRVALVNALNTEKDGTVLIEIIQQLAHYKDKGAIENLEKLTKDEELYKFVRDEAHLGIIQITST